MGVPILMALKIISGWAIGYWWDRNNFYDRESDWQNKRNPVLDGLDRKMLGEDK